MLLYAASCWAEAAADTVAAAVRLATARSNKALAVSSLSSAQILQCSNGTGGCQGDFPTNALEYAAQSKLLTTTDNLSCPAKVCLTSHVQPLPLSQSFWKCCVLLRPCGIAPRQ